MDFPLLALEQRRPRGAFVLSQPQKIGTAAEPFQSAYLMAWMNSPTDLRIRYNALVRVNESALRKSATSEIFDAFCVALRKLLKYDRAALVLYDPDRDSLTVEALYNKHKTSSTLQVGDALPRGSSAEWQVFEHKAYTIQNELTNVSSESDALLQGYKSLCAVPLVARGQSIGVVSLLGRRKSQFSLRHARVLQEMSDQIVLAIIAASPRCSIHSHTKLVCPRCIGAAGGKKTVLKHRERLSYWGKEGGRGRKKPE